jgi:uncharacterized protein
MRHIAMPRFLLTLVFIFVCGAALAYDFPALTGRVVDDAHILSSGTVQQLDASLAAFENQSGDQVVVATIPSLQGGSIEDYGYQLGRQWGIGQKDKNNGAILIVVPNEHKVRIEVGYGLEGTLTDALSSVIIQSVILPQFRKGDMEQGVLAGTDAIISVLGGHADQAMAQAGHNASQGVPFNLLLSIFLWVLFLVARFYLLPWWFPLAFPIGGRGSGGFFGSSGGFGSGGGFSGGGGSFGGGGASGGW